MKVSVTNGIENSGAFSKFTLTCYLILFTQGRSLWSLILFSVLKVLCMEVKKLLNVLAHTFGSKIGLPSSSLIKSVHE